MRTIRRKELRYMLSEEEKKAIGQCKLLLNGDISLHVIDEDDGGTAYCGVVNKLYNKDLEIVLNLIEKQQAEIEKWENIKKELIRQEKSIYDVDAVDDLILEIEKKDKIIDKMADEIYDLGQKQDMRNDNITIWIDKEHILNYFTKLVEEETNESKNNN